MGFKKDEIPLFELANNPTIQIPDMTKEMKAMRARRSGCIVVWDDGEENPCKRIVIREAFMGHRFAII